MSIMTCRGMVNIKFRVLVTVVGDGGNVIRNGYVRCLLWIISYIECQKYFILKLSKKKEYFLTKG